MALVSKLYLTSYNIAQACGWALVLYNLLSAGRWVGAAYNVAGHLVKLLQLVAFLEVLHSAVGLVRSGPITAFMQWAGRSHVVFALISSLPEVQELLAVYVIFAAWSLAEIIRYPQYGLTTLGLCPRWLTWLRYTAFIVLYPIGVLGEVAVMYLSLPHIKRKQLHHDLFRGLPFNYDAFVIGLLCVYPFLWLVLYIHMFQQRRAKLGKRRQQTKRRTQ